MATGDRLSVEWFLEQFAQNDQPVPEPGDWGRLSRDAFVARRAVNARSTNSSGRLRMSGPEVQGNTVDLNAVGAIATAWQRAVAATGAAIEQVKSLRGSLPLGVVLRTSLALNASPQPGSVVLNIAPKASPLSEAEPEGNVPIVDPDRPLADRASEQVIELLGMAGGDDPATHDALSDKLKELGPRAAGALKGLAQVIARTNITLDAAWAEPTAGQVRASVSPTVAKWLTQFVDGRGLNTAEEEIIGVLRTVSDRERWLVEVGDEDVRMNARELDPSVASSWNVGDEVLLTVRVSATERPDGLTRRSMTILSVAARG